MKLLTDAQQVVCLNKRKKLKLVDEEALEVMRPYLETRQLMNELTNELQ